MEDKKEEIKKWYDGYRIGNNEDNIWGLMLGTGYLKVVEVVDLVDGIYKVKLPNYDTSYAFKKFFEQCQYTGDVNNQSELR